MDFQQIRDFVNPAVAQATGLQEVENLSMPVPVAYVPVQLVIDGDLSLTSENPVQNKVIAVAIQNLDGRITAVEGQFAEGVTEAVNNWLAAHPEATTTVQDGAITYAKLDTNLKAEVDQINDLKSTITPIMETIPVNNLEIGTLTQGAPAIDTRYARTATFYPINKGEIITVKGMSYRINGTVCFYTMPYSSFFDSNLSVELDLAANTIANFIAPVTGYFKIRYCPIPAATLTESKIAELNTTTTYNHSVITQNVIPLIPIPSVYMNIKNIDHRGYKNFPENTIPAFKGSKQHGFKYVETDIRFTAADSNNPLGVPVLLHDATINRTARNADGTAISSTINIADITYAQALTYDFGLYKAPDFAGTKIPTFSQFLNACRLYGLIPIVELKAGTREQINMLYEIAVKYGLKDVVIWDGGTPQILYMRDKASNSQLISIQNNFNLELLNSLNANNNKVICGLISSAITDSVVNTLIENGYELCAWTINSVEEFNGLNPYVTWIIGNSIDLVSQIE